MAESKHRVPPRRVRIIAWGIVLSVCLSVLIWTLAYLDQIDVDRWVRTYRSAVHGPEAYRSRVAVGMTRNEVEKQIGSGQRGSMTTVSHCVAPGPGPAPLPPYPIPYTRVEYPEYGFVVVYHGSFGELGDQENSKVIAITP